MCKFAFVILPKDWIFYVFAVNVFLKVSKKEFDEDFDVLIAGFDQNRKYWYFVKKYAGERKKNPIVWHKFSTV